MLAPARSTSRFTETPECTDERREMQECIDDSALNTDVSRVNFQKAEIQFFDKKLKFISFAKQLQKLHLRVPPESGEERRY